jgi:hypothetical protein
MSHLLGMPSFPAQELSTAHNLQIISSSQKPKRRKTETEHPKKAFSYRSDSPGGCSFIFSKKSSVHPCARSIRTFT